MRIMSLKAVWIVSDSVDEAIRVKEAGSECLQLAGISQSR